MLAASVGQAGSRLHLRLTRYGRPRVGWLRSSRRPPPRAAHTARKPPVRSARSHPATSNAAPGSPPAVRSTAPASGPHSRCSTHRCIFSSPGKSFARLDAAAGVIALTDLGCGTGAAGAAWALECAECDVVGLDRNAWAVAEAQWTYRTLGIRGRAFKADVDGMRLYVGAGRADRCRLHGQRTAGSRARGIARRACSTRTSRATRILIVEPIARRMAGWWTRLGKGLCRGRRRTRRMALSTFRSQNASTSLAAPPDSIPASSPLDPSGCASRRATVFVGAAHQSRSLTFRPCDGSGARFLEPARAPGALDPSPLSLCPDAATSRAAHIPATATAMRLRVIGRQDPFLFAGLVFALSSFSTLDLQRLRRRHGRRAHLRRVAAPGAADPDRHVRVPPVRAAPGDEGRSRGRGDGSTARARPCRGTRTADGLRAGLARALTTDAVREAVVRHLPRSPRARTRGSRCESDSGWERLIDSGCTQWPAGAIESIAENRRRRIRTTCRSPRGARAGRTRLLSHDRRRHGRWRHRPAGAGGEPGHAPDHRRRRDAARRFRIRNAQLFANVRDHSVKDALTGCYNRAHGIEVLEVELARSRRSGNPVSVVLFDVDHFKRINDRPRAPLRR